MVMEATLLPVQLITYRQGEPAWDPLKQEMMALPCEMIKIRSVEGGKTCLLYNSDAASCSIYEDRPLECHVLKCWDTREIESLFLKDLLDRRLLFKNSGTLLQLVDAYEKAIPVEDILFFCNASIHGSAEDRARAFDHMKRVADVDGKFRKKAAETLGLGKDDLPFYFGSSATEIFERVKGLTEKNI